MLERKSEKRKFESEIADLQSKLETLRTDFKKASDQYASSLYNKHKLAQDLQVQNESLTEKVSTLKWELYQIGLTQEKRRIEHGDQLSLAWELAESLKR